MPKNPEPILTPQDAVWGRWVNEQIENLQRASERANREQDATNKGLAASLSALGDQIVDLRAIIDAIPLQVASDARATGFSLSDSLTNKVADTITVPDDKTFVNVLCVGVGAALDTTTGGLTTAYGRIVIGGSAGGLSPAAKDHGATFVNNVVNATYARSFAVTPGSTFSVSMQMYGLNGAAFPAQAANSAQIATIATFTS